jgi:ribosomal protein L29
MKTKDFKSLKAKDLKSLTKLVSDKRKELVKKETEIVSGKEKNSSSARNLRKELAKILTLVQEKKILEKLEIKKGESK